MKSHHFASQLLSLPDAPLILSGWFARRDGFELKLEVMQGPDGAEVLVREVECAKVQTKKYPRLSLETPFSGVPLIHSRNGQDQAGSASN